MGVGKTFLILFTTSFALVIGYEITSVGTKTANNINLTYLENRGVKNSLLCVNENSNLCIYKRILGLKRGYQPT